MFTLPHQQSFHPPAQPDAGGSNPDHVLLAVRAYIADRTNSTTATSSTSEGRRVQVSFFAAAPPALSRLCVYCPDAAFTAEPRVIASHGNLILFGVGIRSSSDPFGEATRYDDFVYSAGDGTGGRAALDLLPKPRHPIARANIGLVAAAAAGGGYTVVTLDPDPSCKRFVLHLHHEKTGLWRRKVVSRKILVTDSSAGGGNGRDLKDEVLNFTSTKAIALQGGGSIIAWVDLRRAVLLCDVLDEDPVAYYMPLPEPLNYRNEEYLESPADPCVLRDAVGGRNSVKFVEMEYRYYGADFAPGRWKAVTYRWEIGSKDYWRVDSVVDFDDVLENSGGVLASLSPDKSRGLEEHNIPPLRVPTLCDRDDVLYLTSKPNRRGEGSVVVLDTSTKTLESVIPMSDERVIGYALTYVHCTFSRTEAIK